MHVRSIRLTMALLSIAISCSCGTPESQTKAVPETVDDVVIFKAILADACEQPKARRNHVIVLDRPATLGDEAAGNSQWRLSPEFVAELTRRSSAPALWPKLAPCATQRVVEGALVDSLLARDGTIPPSFAYFRKAFPGVREIVQISLPALSADGQRAIVLRIWKHEIWSSAGEVLELERVGTGWRLVRTRNAWVHAF